MQDPFHDIYRFYLNDTCKDVNVLGWMNVSNQTTHPLLLDLQQSIKPYSSSPFRFISGSAINNIQLDDSKRLAQLNFDEDDIPVIKPYSSNDCYLFIADTSIMSILYDDRIRDLYNTLIMLIQIFKNDNTLSIRTYFLDNDMTWKNEILKTGESIVENPTTPLQYISNCLFGMRSIPTENLNDFKHIMSNAITAIFNSLNTQIVNEMLLYDCQIQFQKNAKINQARFDALNYKINQGMITVENNIALFKETFGIVNGLQVKYVIKDDDDQTINIFSVLNINSELLQSYYSNLSADQYVLHDIDTNNIYVIENDANIIDNQIKLKLRNFSPNPNANYRIKYKNTDYYKKTYNEKQQDIKELSLSIEKNINDQMSYKSSYDIVDSKFKNIDIFSYIMYGIFITILIILFLGHALNLDEKDKVLFSMLMLFVVILIYVVYLFNYPQLESFISNVVPNTDAELYTYFENINATVYKELKDNINMILTFTPVISVNAMYVRIMNVMKKEMTKLNQSEREASYRAHQTLVNLNDKWFNIYKNIAIISALTMFSIIVLVFYSMATMNPRNLTMYIFITVMISIFIIFYYFHFLSRYVRTRYSKFYFMEMKI